MVKEVIFCIPDIITNTTHIDIALCSISSSASASSTKRSFAPPRDPPWLALGLAFMFGFGLLFEFEIGRRIKKKLCVTT